VLYVLACMYLWNIYIYIERERDRDRQTDSIHSNHSRIIFLQQRNGKNALAIAESLPEMSWKLPPEMDITGQKKEVARVIRTGRKNQRGIMFMHNV